MPEVVVDVGDARHDLFQAVGRAWEISSDCPVHLKTIENELMMCFHYLDSYRRSQEIAPGSGPTIEQLALQWLPRVKPEGNTAFVDNITAKGRALCRLARVDRVLTTTAFRDISELADAFMRERDYSTGSVSTPGGSPMPAPSVSRRGVYAREAGAGDNLFSTPPPRAGGRGRGQPSRGGQGGANGAQATQSQDTRPKCVFCGMKNHPTDKCFKLLDQVKAKNEASRRVNQVEPEKEEDQYADEEFYEESSDESVLSSPANSQKTTRSCRP